MTAIQLTRHVLSSEAGRARFTADFVKACGDAARRNEDLPDICLADWGSFRMTADREGKFLLEVHRAVREAKRANTHACLVTTRPIVLKLVNLSAENAQLLQHACSARFQIGEIPVTS